MQKILLSFLFVILYFCSFSNGYFYWNKLKHFKPSFGNIENTTFQLFTRTNNGVLLPMGDTDKVLASGFKGFLPTTFITHGHMDNAQTGWLKKIKKTLLEKEEMNVILIDWAWCAKKILYEPSVACAKETGEYVGKFLLFLQSKAKMDINKAHLIGHSLGGQMISFASKAFPQKKTIGRMTGLDPAGPLFEHANETERLNPKAAKIVDVIHTCRLFTGMVKPVGTIDFYPNGGYFQPGCEPLNLGCQHRASYHYFINSIKMDSYIGKKCETYKNAFKGECFGDLGVMGYKADQSIPGIYFVNVTSIVYNIVYIVILYI